MKRNAVWVKSLTVCLATALMVAGAGYFLVAGSGEGGVAGSKVEAAFYEQDEPLRVAGAAERKIEETGTEEPVEKEETIEESASDGSEGDAASEPDRKEEAPGEALEKPAAGNNSPLKPAASSEPAPVEANSSAGPADEAAVEEMPDEPAVTQSSHLSAPVDHRARSSSGQGSESPAAAPPAPAEAQTVENAGTVTAAPVSYSWGAASSYTFRMEVRVTNNGSDSARNIVVSVPLLENSSPYQTTALKSVNYNPVSTSGRISTFNIGDLAPGETKTITADFDIRVRPVSLNSTNETVEKARLAYEQYAGSGNCRVLAQGFIRKCREMGITAREVVGFARPQRGAMTAGSLQGCRHSWAEFYVEGLGWVPVDLTFQYFGKFPQSSHVVESYGDESIRINYNGGSLSAGWHNYIL